MPNGLFLLNDEHFDQVFHPEDRARAARRLEFAHPPQTAAGVAENPAVLADVDYILGSWGMPVVDEAFLAAAPRLRGIFYAAGSVKGFVTDALWERGIVVTSAFATNAVPVAEFTFAQIILGLKHAWPTALRARAEQRAVPQPPCPGAFGTTVGLVSFGAIARLVRERLRSLEVRVLVFDPFLSAEEADALDVERVPLDEVFRRADVVSVHTPWLPETERLVRGEHIGAMKPGATFLNTARGAVVDEAEMIAVLRARPDLTALLDVTHPEPAAPGSPLFTLPNVVVTPHIAGSLGPECRRMGRSAVDELERFLDGKPLRSAIDRERAALMA